MTRRGLLSGGCAALVACLLGAPVEAEARAAPRVACPHVYCRHNRRDPALGPVCGLSLDRPVVDEGALP